MTIISDFMLRSLAADVRGLESQLTAQVNLLRNAHGWVGPDADKFFSEWDADVRSRMHNSATTLEVMGVTPFI